MNISELLKIINTPERRTALKGICGRLGARVSGVAGSSAAFMIAALPHPKSAPVLVVGDSLDDAGYLYYDLCRVVGDESVAFMPSGYKRDIKYGQADEPARILRTESLRRIADNSVRYVVTYPEAMAETVASADDLAKHTLSLVKGRETDMAVTVKWLRDNGFVQVDYVFEPGQFAVRGSILDIFAYSSELPFRLDFFGDEIDSIRAFNVDTQLSDHSLDFIDVTADVHARGRKQSLPEFLPDNTIVVLRNEHHTVARVEAIAAEGFSALSELAGEGNRGEALNAIVDAAALAERLKTMRRIEFTAARVADETFADGTPIAVPTGRAAVDYNCSPQGIYHKNFDLIAESFTRFLADGYRLCILSDNSKQFERLRDIFADRGDDITFEPVEGTIHEGFVDHTARVCVFTDHQIFDRFHKYTLKSDRARTGKMALSLRELGLIKPGDYIVHVDHGVGRFDGLLTNTVNGVTQEVIKLSYDAGDVLLVNITSLHKLSKYRGKEGVPPKINRIGSGNWQKLKDRTKGKLKDIARDLIKLYAARRDEKGFAFSPDTYMQHELEASFIYEDTPDQLTATQAVKADMEKPQPMDRLVCGDVGFGKTEIAIRAAFKAAADGKQVAVLVPTTVLAYQHYNTFRERLADFPVRVEYLSRARTAKETKQILADLEAGKIDIIVGTHKLIGKAVKFKDLGLLIVDEEQKFGVAVKERLRQMRVNVDTLTLTATPIPRTLQFSLMGARDLSTLTTPPPNRYPIITNVGPLDDDALSEALNFELSRGGQVFIINPRIEGLFALEDRVRRLVPDARTVVAHGQMPPERLEKTITDFTAHDYDILLATTILESGIDMPNVNTIIINDAHRFGLSELHQLRGRVGRSARKAFCYLVVPGDLSLSDDARRRLQAIESFSDLGAGIQIAMQDLDIRGAGNLLGAEQSGFIADLGYETYQKILREAVTELRNEEFPDLPSADDDRPAEFVADCVIDSDLELLLPPDYVEQESERIALYRELDSIERPEQLAAFEQRLVDRFGRIPAVARELLRVPSLRSRAKRLGIEKVTLKQGKMFTYFVGQENEAYYKSDAFGRILSYATIYPQRVEIRQRGERRSFIFADVASVSDAVAILDTILTLPVA